MKHAEKVQWLGDWCATNDLVLELEGEVGFGRECVGILRGSHYVDYDDGRLAPGDDAPDAYHKHDCLAVLGRGRNAESQLYAWVHRLVAQGARVETVKREPYNTPPNLLELAIHGMHRTRLALPRRTHA